MPSVKQPERMNDQPLAPTAETYARLEKECWSQQAKLEALMHEADAMPAKKQAAENVQEG